MTDKAQIESILSILEINRAIVEQLAERVTFLESELDEAREMIRGLEVDCGQNSEAINNLQSEQDNYRWELDEIGAEVDVFTQGLRR
jgi:predicted nuclease with TOPRIM domain